MVENGDPRTTADAAAYVRLQDDLYRIAERAARRPEFADELDELRLNRMRVAVEVADDPAVLSRARLAYQPILDQQERLAAHRHACPSFWPPRWRPDPARVAVIAAVLLPVAWWMVIGSRTADLPLILLVLVGAPLLLAALVGAPLLLAALVGAPLLLAALLAARVLAKWGLPETTWRWQRWFREHVRLRLRIPVQKLDWQQSIRDEVVLPEIREWINRHKVPSFDHVLRLRDVSGLALPADQGPVVHTSSIQRCVREINRSAPGAVGLAGRRGLRAAAAPRSPDPEPTGRPPGHRRRDCVGTTQQLHPVRL